MTEPMPGAAPAQQDEDPVAPAVSAHLVQPVEESGAAPGSGPGTGDAAAEPGAPGGTEPAAQEPQEDDGPRPLGLRVTPTGHAPVDGQLRRLQDADRLAVSGHLEMYEDVHRGLRDTLTALDRPAPGPGHPAPGPPHNRS